MAVLTSADPTVVKQKIALESSPVTIGRHPECDVIIDNGSVSRYHAKIVNEAGSFYIQDLKSRNGTFLNGDQILQPSKLYDGSEIRICDVRFNFFLSDNLPSISSYRSSSGSEVHSSIVIDDDGDDKLSTIMSQLDVPSHHSQGSVEHVSAEDKLKALIQITEAVSQSVEQEQIFDNILSCLFDLFLEADRGFILFKLPDGKLQPVATKNRRPQDDELVHISRSIVNRAMEKGPLISSDAAADSRFNMSQSIADFRIRSMMCAPLINSDDESIGVIQLDTLKRSIAFKEEDLEILVTVAMQASLAIQKSQLYEESKKAEEIKNDLQLAHELQQRFLPQRCPTLEGYEFFSYYKPMQQVGGDYYDYIPLDGNRIAILVADVVGHGITAAMMMAKVSAEARFALASEPDPLQAIAQINSNLSGLNVDRFVTLVMAILDLNDHSLNVVNAGHMPPILRHSENGQIEMIAEAESGLSGLPLGIMDEAEYFLCRAEIGPGDVVLMYTDGINEAMDVEGNQLTLESLVDEIQQSQTKTADAIGNLVCQTVSRHIGMHPPIDDMCVVCVGRREN